MFQTSQYTNFQWGGGRLFARKGESVARCVVFFYLTIAAAGVTRVAVADPRSALTPGLYQAGLNSCSSPTGAGTMSFDGTNFSGNHQFCRTAVIAGPDRYRLTCMDLMPGPNGMAKTPADFDRVPDKETIDVTIKIENSRRFAINGQQYSFCEALK